MIEVTLSRLLALIRKRPLMYLDEAKATRLEAFILGFVFAEAARNDDLSRHILGNSVYHEFRLWLVDRIKPKTRDDVTGTLITCMANWLIEYTGSEEKAFDKFFELYEEFVKTHDVGMETLEEAQAFLDEYHRGSREK